MSKFAALALMAVNAGATWSDLAVGNPSQQYEPTSREAKHLANLLGMDENKIYPEASNSLDELAQAMLEQNLDYAKDPEHDIPTFHVVHSEDESFDIEKEEAEAELLNLDQNDEGTSSSISSNDTSSEQSSSSVLTSSSSEQSSASSEETVEQEAPAVKVPAAAKHANENVFAPRRMPRDTYSQWARNQAIESSESSSSLVSSDSEAEIMQMANSALQQQRSPPQNMQKWAEDMVNGMTSEDDEEQDPLEKQQEQKKQEQKKQEQLEKKMKSPSLNKKKPEQFNQADLDALQAIQERLAHTTSAESELKQEDVHTLTQKIDFAEQQLQERLQKNLKMYHDLQKLREKPHEEFTTQDLLFVKQTMCTDGICLGQAYSGLSVLTTLGSLCSLALFLF